MASVRLHLRLNPFWGSKHTKLSIFHCVFKASGIVQTLSLAIVHCAHCTLYSTVYQNTLFMYVLGKLCFAVPDNLWYREFYNFFIFMLFFKTLYSVYVQSGTDKFLVLQYKRGVSAKASGFIVKSNLQKTENLGSNM